MHYAPQRSKVLLEFVCEEKLRHELHSVIVEAEEASCCLVFILVFPNQAPLLSYTEATCLNLVIQSVPLSGHTGSLGFFEFL